MKVYRQVGLLVLIAAASLYTAGSAQADDVTAAEPNAEATNTATVSMPMKMHEVMPGEMKKDGMMKEEVMMGEMEKTKVMDDALKSEESTMEEHKQEQQLQK